MPYYDYLCVTCGSFTESRPMAQSALPQPCPDCAVPAPRAILSAPRMTTMSAERRTAFATNERSASNPRVGGGKHAAGCSCCSGLGGKSKQIAPSAAKAAKSFPAARPWMISH